MVLAPLPSGQLGNPSRQKPHGYTRNTGFPQFASDPELHFLRRNIRQRELPRFKAVGAVHQILGTVSVRSAAFFVPAHGHSAGLAVLVRLSNLVHGGLLGL